MAICILSWKFGFSVHTRVSSEMYLVCGLAGISQMYYHRITTCALSFYVDHAITCNLGVFSKLAIIQNEIAEW